METIERGYEFFSRVKQNGIEMDITVKTTREMAMSELLGIYAALSHGIYLDIANDISEQKH
ncbi:MAG: hypothetical protein E7201_06825 [Selenomonas ruminantium]|uniref:Uncharacterized protein n=1 Tax=Selenomonas ruminantium TaxID=971 RepID=A0A927WNR8_SELRU|nr:hypothetical protein [Selenomonas ruminantium]